MKFRPFWILLCTLPFRVTPEHCIWIITEFKNVPKPLFCRLHRVARIADQAEATAFLRRLPTRLGKNLLRVDKRLPIVWRVVGEERFLNFDRFEQFNVPRFQPLRFKPAR